MKKNISLFVWALATAIGVMLAGLSDSQAQYSQSSALVVGTYPGARRVMISSYTATALLADNAKRLDSLCFNNGLYTIWIGSVATAANGTTHTHIINGFPVLASSTFRVGGILTGVVYATCDTGIASCEMRCFDGLIY